MYIDVHFENDFLTESCSTSSEEKGGILISLPTSMKIYREAVLSTTDCSCRYSSQFLAFGDWPITNPIEVGKLFFNMFKFMLPPAC